MSLCYILVYLSSGGKVRFMAKDEGMSKSQIFHYVRKVKAKMQPTDLVGTSKPGCFLLPFVKEISSYGFKTTPNYDSLRAHLHSCLQQIGQLADNLFDWNEKFQQQIRIGDDKINKLSSNGKKLNSEHALEPLASFGSSAFPEISTKPTLLSIGGAKQKQKGVLGMGTLTSNTLSDGGEFH